MTTPAPAPAEQAEERVERDVDIWNPGGDPGVLRARAGDWRTAASGLRDRRQRLEGVVTSTVARWEGSASGAFATYWTELSTGVEETAAAFDEVAGGLDEIADEIERVNEEVHQIYVEIGITVAAGVALSVVTMGFSGLLSAGAAAAGAARAATLVARLGSFLLRMRAVIAASRVALVGRAAVFSRRIAGMGTVGAHAARAGTTAVRIGRGPARLASRVGKSEFAQRTAINAAANVGARSIYYGTDGDGATSGNPLDWSGEDWAAVGLSSAGSAGISMAGARLPIIGGSANALGRAPTEGYLGGLGASVVNNTLISGEPLTSGTLEDGRHAGRVSAVTTIGSRGARDAIRPHLPPGRPVPDGPPFTQGAPGHILEAPIKVPGDAAGKGGLPSAPGFGPSDPIITRPSGAPEHFDPVDPSLPGAVPVADPSYPRVAPPAVDAVPGPSGAAEAGPPPPAGPAPDSGSGSGPEPGATATPQELPTVTVRPGDSLSAIAERELGDERRWPEIHELNDGQIDDPDLIHPGQELVLPRR